METNRDAIIAHLGDEIVGARQEQYDLTTLIQRRNNLKGKYRDMVEDIENQKVQISESLIDIDKNIKQASSKRDVVEEDIKAFEDLYRETRAQSNANGYNLLRGTFNHNLNMGNLSKGDKVRWRGKVMTYRGIGKSPSRVVTLHDEINNSRVKVLLPDFKRYARPVTSSEAKKPVQVTLPVEAGIFYAPELYKVVEYEDYPTGERGVILELTNSGGWRVKASRGTLAKYREVLGMGIREGEGGKTDKGTEVVYESRRYTVTGECVLHNGRAGITLTSETGKNRVVNVERRYFNKHATVYKEQSEELDQSGIGEAQVLATINMYEAIRCRVDEKEVRAKCSEYAKGIVAQGNPYRSQTGIKSIKGKLKEYLVKDIKHTVDAQGLVAVLRSDWVRHLPVEAPTYHVGDKDKEGLEDVYRRDKLYNLPKYAQVTFLDLYDTIPDEIFTYLGVMTDMLRGEQMVKVRSDKRGAFNIHRSTFINQARIVTDQEQESNKDVSKRNKLYYLSKGTKIKDRDGKVYTYEGIVNSVLDREIIRIRTVSNTVTTMYRDLFINGDYQILEYRMSNGKHKNNSVDRLKLINMNIGSKVTLPNRDGTDTPPLVYTYQGSTTTPSGTEAVILYTPTGRTQVMHRLEFINEALLISEVKEENKKKDNKHINNSTDMLKLIDIKVDDRVTLPNRDGEQSSIIYRYVGKVDYDGYIIVRLRNAVGRVVQVRREQFIEEARIVAE